VVLLLLFFLLLDLVSQIVDEVGAGTTVPKANLLRRYGVHGAAALLIALVTLFYSPSMALKAQIQLDNLSQGKAFFPAFVVKEDFYPYIGRIREATGQSDKVYYLAESDFGFYYNGGYAPVGYCNPFLTWVFMKDLHGFLQKLLDQGYYLVCTPEMKFLLPDLRFDRRSEVGDTSIVTKTAGMAQVR
jgi:hypothetical protein